MNAPLASRLTIVPAVLFGVASLVIVTTPVFVFTLIPLPLVLKLTTPSFWIVIASVVGSVDKLIAVPPTSVSVSSGASAVTVV